MQKTKLIYLIALALGIYSLVIFRYSVVNGALILVVIAIISLTGAIGLLILKAWARYFIYTSTIMLFFWWMIHTIWLISHKGWPYYPTSGQSIIELVTEVALYLFWIFSCVVVNKYFKNIK
jgi:hypothetical protein